MTLIVDGNNLIGATPDGWWRDRPAAVRRLLGRLQCLAVRTGERILLVLDVPQDDLAEGQHDGVAVHYPARRGRNAADERILQLLEGDAGEARVVTSDRDLAAQAAGPQVEVVGVQRFLAKLDDAGC